jgi:ubiquinone/menaquinone biosynthesis C-methylase UbiE
LLNDVQRFNQLATRRDPSWLSALWPGAMHRAVFRALGPVAGTETILDIGCGIGGLLHAVRRRWPGVHTIGVDPAEKALEVAREKTPDGLFMVGHAEVLPLPTASADIAVSTFSFHHWRDQATGLREVARVLRPQGTFVLLEPSPPSWISNLLRAHRFATKQETESLLTAVGFRVESSRSQWLLCRITVARKEERQPQ